MGDTGISAGKHMALSERIVRNRNAIFSKFTVPMMEKYYWLADNLHARNVSHDAEYRRKFGGYYKMRFVSETYRDSFFALFEKIKTDGSTSFETVAAELFSVEGKHEFSFITKMLHTINPVRPIYDSKVQRALGIRRKFGSDFGAKIRQDCLILKQISSTCRLLASESEMGPILSDFDRIYPEREMSVEKKLDFILWALGSLE